MASNAWNTIIQESCSQGLQDKSNHFHKGTDFKAIAAKVTSVPELQELQVRQGQENQAAVLKAAEYIGDRMQKCATKGENMELRLMSLEGAKGDCDRMKDQAAYVCIVICV